MRNYANMQEKVTLRLDGYLADRLRTRAARERVPLSVVLRHLVIRFLEGKPVDERPAFPRPTGDGRRVLAASVDERQAFREDVCALFDDFRGQGLDVKEATRRTNFALKAKQHPWATHDVVSKALRDCGRFRTVRGVKR
jgi:hypothetical protein